MKNLVAAGCSFTLDNFQKTWADYLAESLGYKLTNLGARGAGIDFISKRVMYHCSTVTPDLVVIMLPSADRFDWYVDQHHPLRDDAVKISSWQDGKGPSLLGINGQPSYTEGYSLTGGEIRGHKKYWFKYYYSEESTALNYWTTVYNLENFFKAKQIPYYFTMAYDRDSLVEQHYNLTGNSNNFSWIFNCIDWQRFIFYQDTQGFLSFTQDQNFDIIGHYPTTDAHRAWVEQILMAHIVFI